MQGPDEKPEKYSAPALSKGLDILEFLAGETRGQKKSDIARALNRSVGEIFRMLAVLERRGYISLDADSEQYSLTTRLFEIAHRHSPIRRLSAIAGERMTELAIAVNQSVHLAVLSGDHVLVLAGSESPGNHVMSVRLGARIPLVQTASGAVLTAHLTSQERRSHERRFHQIPAKHRTRYRENCSLVREHGYCESASTTIEGVVNLSAPVRDHVGDVVAALTIPFVRRLSRDTPMTLERTRGALVSCAGRISRLLGSDAGEQPAETAVGKHPRR